MESRKRDVFLPLPGSDALKSAPLFKSNSDYDYEKVLLHFEEGGHRNYLNNAAYDQYLHMHKVVVGEVGASKLKNIGAELENETLPTYLEAAGWAYVEAGLAASSLTTTERVELVNSGEKLWQRSLVRSAEIAEMLGGEYRYGDNEGHRTALNLAFAPLVKSIIVGNVRPNVIQKVLLDTAEISHDSKLSLDRAYDAGDTNAIAYHKGLLFEASALMALLYLDDPRYVPLPATARSDTGYYHREQTHDISVINQHWGEIRKIIPLEIKSKASLRDKRRYKALIIPGKMRLSIEGVDPRDTVDAFYGLVHNNATTKQIVGIEQLSTQLREMLRLYQKGVSPEGLAMNSLTRFYDSKAVVEKFPELSKEPQPPRKKLPS